MKLLKSVFLYNIKGCYMQYKYTGFASLYVSENQAYCNLCERKFSFEPRYISKSFKLYCPHCGRLHHYKDMVISNRTNTDLPYTVKMKLYEFKTKIELRIKYKSISLTDCILDNTIFSNLREIYIFDVKNKAVMWKKYKDNLLIENENIGYLSDYDLKSKMAISYISLYQQRDVYFLLSALRTALTQKTHELHAVNLKNLYAGKLSKKDIFFGNIINLAHRVRFFDSINIAYDDNLMNLCKIVDLPIEFEHEKMTSSYIEHFIKALKLPNTALLRKKLTIDNMCILKEIYNKNDERMAKCLFDFYNKKQSFFMNEHGNFILKLKSSIEKMSICSKFINIFYKNYYSHVHLNIVLDRFANTNEITDILNLWKEANQDTKNSFHRENVPFRNLHDWLSLKVTEQKENEILFNIPNDVLNKFKIYMMNHAISCIDRYSQLQFIATSLKNCSVGYKSRINENLQLVVISDDSGKPKVLLEIKKSSIVQAKLYRNVPVWKDNSLNSLVICFAKNLDLKIETQDIHFECIDKLAS